MQPRNGWSMCRRGGYRWPVLTRPMTRKQEKTRERSAVVRHRDPSRETLLTTSERLRACAGCRRGCNWEFPYLRLASQPCSSSAVMSGLNEKQKRPAATNGRGLNGRWVRRSSLSHREEPSVIRPMLKNQRWRANNPRTFGPTRAG